MPLSVVNLGSVSHTQAAVQDPAWVAGGGGPLGNFNVTKEIVVGAAVAVGSIILVASGLNATITDDGGNTYIVTASDARWTHLTNTTTYVCMKTTGALAVGQKIYLTYNFGYSTGGTIGSGAQVSGNYYSVNQTSYATEAQAVAIPGVFLNGAAGSAVVDLNAVGGSVAASGNADDTAGGSSETFAPAWTSARQEISLVVARGVYTQTDNTSTAHTTNVPATPTLGGLGITLILSAKYEADTFGGTTDPLDSFFETWTSHETRGHYVIDTVGPITLPADDVYWGWVSFYIAANALETSLARAYNGKLGLAYVDSAGAIKFNRYDDAAPPTVAATVTVETSGGTGVSLQALRSGVFDLMYALSGTIKRRQSTDAGRSFSVASTVATGYQDVCHLVDEARGIAVALIWVQSTSIWYVSVGTLNEAGTTWSYTTPASIATSANRGGSLIRRADGVYEFSYTTTGNVATIIRCSSLTKSGAGTWS